MNNLVLFLILWRRIISLCHFKDTQNHRRTFSRVPKSLLHIFKDIQIVVAHFQRDLNVVAYIKETWIVFAHFRESQIVVVHFPRDPNCHCTFSKRPELCGKITFELKRMKTWLKNVAHDYVGFFLFFLIIVQRRIGSQGVLRCTWLVETFTYIHVWMLTTCACVCVGRFWCCFFFSLCVVVSLFFFTRYRFLVEET